MYVPAHFREHDPAVAERLIADNPLACVVAQVAGELVANHLPLKLVSRPDAPQVLVGHVARANDLWRNVTSGTPVLAVFAGANRYITPAWYEAKATSGEVVPTWNYAVVHMHGRVSFVHDPDRLRALVDSLTTQHESARPAPWAVADAPADYVRRMLGGIVGIEIEVSRVECKVKASQNRSAGDRARIDAGLAADGVPAAERGDLVRGTPATEPPRGRPAPARS